MTEKLGRLPTEEETEQARAVAMQLVEALRSAPNVAVGIGGVGMFVEQTFMHAIKSEYLLKAFDEWTASVRKSMEKGLRRAHN